MGKILVGKRNILNNIVVALAKIKVIIQKIERINIRKVKIPVFAFLPAAGYVHARIINRSFHEIFLPPCLHLYDESVPRRVPASYIEMCIPAGFGLPLDVGILDNDISYRMCEFPFEKSVEQSDEQIFVFLACEHFFEREIQGELCVSAFRHYFYVFLQPRCAILSEP